jgi:hypothetical protein
MQVSQKPLARFEPLRQAHLFGFGWNPPPGSTVPLADQYKVSKLTMEWLLLNSAPFNGM